MKLYSLVALSLGPDRIKEFAIENFNVISASIKSILTQVRSNRTKIDEITIEAWSTVSRPKSTPNAVTVGINLTTGNFNYTTDSGKNWKNYDGTAA